MISYWALVGITVLLFVTDFIPAEIANMATALTAYVNEGPKVQQDAQAVNAMSYVLIKYERFSLPKSGPMARPS